MYQKTWEMPMASHRSLSDAHEFIKTCRKQETTATEITQYRASRLLLQHVHCTGYSPWYHEVSDLNTHSLIQSTLIYYFSFTFIHLTFIKAFLLTASVWCSKPVSNAKLLVFYRVTGLARVRTLPARVARSHMHTIAAQRVSHCPTMPSNCIDVMFENY